MSLQHLLIAAAAMAMAESASAETISLGRSSGGTYTVAVTINNTMTLRFTLDTGASSVVIPMDVGRTLVRTGTVSPNDFLKPVITVLADGSRHESERFILHEVRVGDHAISNVVATISPVAGDPLLGQSFLSKLPSWSIDNRQQALVINDVAISEAGPWQPPGTTAPAVSPYAYGCGSAHPCPTSSRPNWPSGCGTIYNCYASGYWELK
jgi:clan AA aspartic protease (TIGR02281 family)